MMIFLSENTVILTGLYIFFLHCFIIRVDRVRVVRQSVHHILAFPFSLVNLPPPLSVRCYAMRFADGGAIILISI